MRPLGPGDLLRAAIRADRSLLPQGTLADWMRLRGWAGRPLTPADLRAWLARWTFEAQQRRACSLRPGDRGPGVSRGVALGPVRVASFEVSSNGDCSIGNVVDNYMFCISTLCHL